MIFRRQSWLQIGRFQLENLLHNQVPFVFLRVISERDRSLPAEVLALVQAATEVAARAEVDDAVQGLPDEHPVVLLCFDGKQSQRLARHLGRRGFTNVFVVAGGLVGLSADEA